MINKVPSDVFFKRDYDYDTLMNKDFNMNSFKNLNHDYPT